MILQRISAGPLYTSATFVKGMALELTGDFFALCFKENYSYTIVVQIAYRKSV